jgi:ribonuclease R
MARDKERLVDLLARKDYVPATAEELSTRLRVAPHQRVELERTLQDLERNGQVIRTKQGRYIKAREADLIPGIIRINRQGRGYVRPDDPALPEVMIPESATSTALDRDRVLVRLDVNPQGLRRDQEDQLTGAVVRILECKRKHLVGTLRRSPRFLYVIPDDPRVPHDIYVPEPKDVGRPAREGDKVVVELRDWESRHTNPEGEVVEVLGPADAEGVDLLSVIRQYDLALHFPKEALAQANAIAKAQPVAEPTREESHGRTDCRSHAVVTIDPEDAKDFDDAICLQAAPNNHWRLWVHIADVSHYVEPDTPLDQEARKRGNSTYLVDRVIPMLPEALSNELCSLKPHVDRLTKCVEFLLTPEGKVVKARFYPAVIRSQRRYNYKEAVDILRRKPADAIERMLHQAHELAQRIRGQRFKSGALDLDFPETKIVLDPRGRVARIEKVVNDESHQLIEEFMLLANEAVAAELRIRRRTGIHRVHEPPDERRLREYREDLLRHKVQCGNLARRPEVQRLLQRLNALPIGPALKIGFLRSLKRARYDVKALGHYGLNKEDYTHFTSPIRRYADLVVHRALFNNTPLPRNNLESVADHISETERNSDEAERDSRDVKLLAFLNEQLRTGQLQEYEALVTEVRNFGFFVDVQGLGMSGLVHLSSVEDDFYVFDPARVVLIGRRTRRVITLGDKVRVTVAKVDTFKKQVDFKLVKQRGDSRTEITSRRSERPGNRASSGGRQKGKARRFHRR